jgi:hypothetical protein
MRKQQDIEYDDIHVTMLEIIWGEGFLSSLQDTCCPSSEHI